MNAALITVICVVMGQADVQTDAEAKTQLYVKTTPPGAIVLLDGGTLGNSNGLFDVAPGAHKLVLQMEGYASDERSIEVRQRQITRIEAVLRKPSGEEAELGYVHDSSEAKWSFGASGHAVVFQRPAGMRSIAAVKLFAARYGREEPPNEDFHIYLLDQDQKVLEQIPVPYRKVERGELRWQTFTFPAVEVPEKFFVALWFNAEGTKGVYMGVDTNVKESHSYVGLPDKGFHKADQGYYDWMVRAVVTPENGKKPSYPKVTTYEDEKAADTESKEALPTRTWNDSTGASVLKAQLVSVENGKVRLKKADGKTVAIPLDRLSKEDQDFLARQSGAKQEAVKAGRGETRQAFARRRGRDRQIEHRGRRACRAICGQRRRVARDLREPARIALRGSAGRRRRISTSGSATSISSPSPRSTSPTVRTPAAPRRGSRSASGPRPCRPSSSSASASTRIRPRGFT